MIPTPANVRALVKGKIIQTESADFLGNGRPGYIVRVEDRPANSEEPSLESELWLSADLKQIKRRKLDGAEIFYRWFIKLDEKSTPQMIVAEGYEDGVEYGVYEQSFGAGSMDNLLFDFDPVIRDPSRDNDLFWGYPWDITDAIFRKTANHYDLSCSFRHSVKGDFEMVKLPGWQKSVPVLFFSGKTTQPENATFKDALIDERHWCSLAEMRAKVRHPVKRLTANYNQ